jgi:hypothetical protein
VSGAVVDLGGLARRDAPFWVYWRTGAIDARSHHAWCAQCNNGRGKMPIDSGRNGGWIPCDTAEEAARAARRMFPEDTAPCPFCRP